MGLGPAVVSPDAGVSCHQRMRQRLSRRKRQAADVLRRYIAAGGEHRAGLADGCRLWLWREISGQISEGFLHHGLVVWPAYRGAYDANGVELYRDLGKLHCPQIAAQYGAEISAEPDRHGDRRRWGDVFCVRRAQYAGVSFPCELCG